LDLQFFSQFIRMNYPQLSSFSKEELNMLGFNFKKYLENIFKDNRCSLEHIWNISPIRVEISQDHTVKIFSYEPSLVIHFGLFVEKITREFDEKGVNSLMFNT